MNVYIDTPDIMGIAAAFLTQVGARHLIFDFTSAQQKLISHPISQALIMFGMFYLSTRRLSLSIILLVLYYILIGILINEKHPLNIIPRKWLISEGFLDARDKSPIDVYHQNLERFIKAY